jgi:hypothetical protein
MTPLPHIAAMSTLRRNRGFIINPFAFGGAGPDDPYDAFVKVLLRFDGTNGSTSIVDETGNNTWTCTGNAQLSTSTPKFGSAALLLDGTGDFVSGGAGTFWKFLHDGTLWTMEIFFKAPTWGTTRTVFDTARGTTSNSGVYCAINGSRQIVFFITKGDGSTYVVNGTFSNTVPNDSNWHYLQIDFDHSLGSANAKCWIDGANEATLNKTGNTPSSGNAPGNLYLGTFNGTNDMWNGSFDSFRITGGMCRGQQSTPTSDFPYP